MTAVGAVNKTGDLLQLMAQLQIILSNRYYRARHALASLSTKHTGEVETLLRQHSTESQALKDRHKEAIRQLLDLQKQVADRMRREITELQGALEAAGCTRAWHQHEEAGDEMTCTSSPLACATEDALSAS